MLTELTIKEFIHKVISNDPVPGEIGRAHV